MAEPTRAELVLELSRVRGESEDISALKTKYHIGDDYSLTEMVEELKERTSESETLLDDLAEKLGVVEDGSLIGAVEALLERATHSGDDPGYEPEEEPIPTEQYVRYTGGGSLGFNYDGQYVTIGTKPIALASACAEWALHTYEGQVVAVDPPIINIDSNEGD